MNRVTCEQALELLMDFLKRELSPDVAEAVRQHLDECKPCERHARFESRFVVLVETRLRSERCPESLKARILDSLIQEGGE